MGTWWGVENSSNCSCMGHVQYNQYLILSVLITTIVVDDELPPPLREVVLVLRGGY